jgi:hypothetical protein
MPMLGFKLNKLSHLRIDISLKKYGAKVIEFLKFVEFDYK